MHAPAATYYVMPLSRPVPLQGQVPGPPGPHERGEVLGAHVLGDGAAHGPADEHADDLGVLDDAEADGVVQEAEEGVLGDAPVYAFCEDERKEIVSVNR